MRCILDNKGERKRRAALEELRVIVERKISGKSGK
jgi:hypothetical protein